MCFTMKGGTTLFLTHDNACHADSSVQLDVTR